MLVSDRLPTFTFISPDGSETMLQLASVTPRVRAVAQRLRDGVEPGSVVGLLYTSSPDLVINWLACLMAGLQPLIMQYPTRKQSRDYWIRSVENTIQTVELAVILADAHCAGMGLEAVVETVSQAELDQLPDGGADPYALDDFAIVQLSSGTTGHRKGVRFGSVDLFRHAEDYNRMLRLTRDDRIVSWLPLYHDMGYVACFVMPMMLGVDVVMMDAMTWVGSPERLFDAIDRHAGTVCYMPNFGFEVMAREEPRTLPSTRWWVSCSEPVSAATARKFLALTGAAEDTFAPCYAMAENIFAVSLRRGLETRTIDGVEVVSCGPPIAGVEVKVVEGEIWVRSPTSLKAYIGGDDIRDSEGFYPTGDLGELSAEGEIYVTGRKQDLLIQAGRSSCCRTSIWP